MKQNRDEFDHILEAVETFRAGVDELGVQYSQEVEERNVNGVPSDWDFVLEAEWYAAQVGEMADTMLARVNEQLSALADRLAAWQTKAPADSSLLAYLLAIRTAGLPLTSAQCKALEARAAGNYLALVLLEPMSGGFVTAPDVHRLEFDLGAIRTAATGLIKYRGKDDTLAEVCGCTQNAVASAARARGSMDSFAQRIIEPTKTRWAHI